MYKLLIVDDEVYAVQAVERGIDWQSLGFSDVLCAFDAEEAISVLQENAVDVMICDIEMPGENGVALLEWMNEHAPSTVTIFLTAHADFDYAQQVVRLAGFDYLLKPVKYEQLAQVVERALAEVQGRKEAKRFEEMYKSYAKERVTQKPLLKELFWQDVFSKRIHPTPDHLQELSDTYQVQFGDNRLVLPILLSVENWKKEFTDRDEDILGYALRNAAAELLVPASAAGDVVQDRGGILFALLYLKRPDEYSRSRLKEACERYIRVCSLYFYCNLSCYVGTASPVHEVIAEYYRLVELEQTNVSGTGQVLFLSDAAGDCVPASGKPPSFAFDSAEWTRLLEAGKTEAVIHQIEELFNSKSAGERNAEMLEELYHTLLGYVYQAVHQRGGSVKQIFGTSRQLESQTATRSVAQLLAWARRLIHAMADFFDRNRTESSAVVEKVKSYMEAHLSTVTREGIASVVYLNSAYLSRLFKRETGTSLMEYIISMKMNRAKLLLTQSNTKIGDICDQLGYENLPHFAKTFKKQVGVTPQEYRKRYQAIP